MLSTREDNSFVRVKFVAGLRVGHAEPRVVLLLPDVSVQLTGGVLRFVA